MTEYKVLHTQQSRKKTLIVGKSQGNRKKTDSTAQPNRDSLIEDLNKTEDFNPFSEKSKELIISIGNTEYFKLCEISS